MGMCSTFAPAIAAVAWAISHSLPNSPLTGSVWRQAGHGSVGRKLAALAGKNGAAIATTEPESRPAESSAATGFCVRRQLWTARV